MLKIIPTPIQRPEEVLDNCDEISDLADRIAAAARRLKAENQAPEPPGPTRADRYIADTIDAAKAAEQDIMTNGTDEREAAYSAACAHRVEPEAVLYRLEKRRITARSRTAFCRRFTARAMRDAGFSNGDIARVLKVHIKTVPRLFRPLSE